MVDWGAGLIAESAWKGDEENRSWLFASKAFGVEGSTLDWEVARGFLPLYLRGEGERKAELPDLPKEDLFWVERDLPLEGGNLGVE